MRKKPKPNQDSITWTFPESVNKHPHENDNSLQLENLLKHN